jgi:hypothetical protein
MNCEAPFRNHDLTRQPDGPIDLGTENPRDGVEARRQPEAT